VTACRPPANVPPTAAAISFESSSIGGSIHMESHGVVSDASRRRRHNVERRSVPLTLGATSVLALAVA
jgi:hypothetical protein